MIITIDGPAGSGKSTAARGLAERLGFEFLDTGAMYRAVALVLRRAGIEFSDEAHVDQVLRHFQLDMKPGLIMLNGEDVSKMIRTPEMNSASSEVAAYANVRKYLVGQQRKIAEGRHMVCEGRDQGTVVFPNAHCKFFLTANVESRAERRYQEITRRGHKVSREQVLAEQIERDERDSQRKIDPLRPAENAIIIDTSDMSAEEVLDRLEEEARRCLPG